MLDYLKSFRSEAVFFAIGSIALGLILMIWPDPTLSVAGKVAGVFLIIGGVYLIYRFFKNHDFGWKVSRLIFGAILIAIGVYFFRTPENLARIFPIVLGISMVIGGVINVGEALTLSKYHYSKWWVSLLIAAATIVLGVYLIREAYSVAAFATRVAGFALIFSGASYLWTISRATNVIRDMKQDMEAIDTEGEVKER